MADVGSIIAILQLSGLVAKSVTDYIKNWHNIPTFLKNLAGELEQLERCLQEVQNRVDADPNSVFLRNALSLSKDSIDSVHRTLTELQAICHSPKWFRRHLKRLQIPLREADTIRCTNDIQKIKLDLILAFHAADR
jgi:hypothetical protein